MASGNAFQDPNWIWTTHMFFAIGTIALWQILSYVLKQRKSALPQLDGFVLAIALAGTILQLLYIELNWYYFILVNITSIYTYWNRGMKKSVILYLVYLGLSVYGIIH
jgi:nicotinamide riboside transporter PnuC